MDKGIVLVSVQGREEEWELEVPLNVSVKEISTVLSKALDFEKKGIEISCHYIRTENPTCFLKGNDILNNYNIGFGSKITLI